MKQKNQTAKRNAGREDLTGEHPLSDTGQLICLCAFLTVWGIDTFLVNFSIVLSNQISPWLRYSLGPVLVVIAVVLVVKSHGTILDEVRQEPQVVREGAFGVVRHPMYLGSQIFYLGLVVMSLSLASAVVWAFIVAFYHYIARHEERLLLARFGDDYRHYMSEVSMWLPTFPLHHHGHVGTEEATGQEGRN